MPRVRFAVALLLPPGAAAEVDGLRRAVGDTMREKVPPHLTFVPPTNVNVNAVPVALAVARAAGSRERPFTLALGPAATFLPDSPVVYLSVSGDIGAVVRIRDALRAAPFDRPDPWPFVPHVTLGDNVDEARVPALLRALGEYRIEVAFDRLHVLQEGADRVWRPVADVPFAPPAIVGRGGLPVELTVTGLADPEAAALLPEGIPELPVGAEPLVVTARREGVLGVLAGWTRGAEAGAVAVATSDEGAAEDVERHLWAAAESAAAERASWFSDRKT